MAEGEESTHVVDLLHPEILSKEELISILKERNVQVPAVASLSKDSILELYYQNVIPMPQRKYRSNRRGLEMTKKQILMAKRKRTHEEMTYTNHNIFKKPEDNTNSNTRFLCSFNLPSSSGDRLKPPPVLTTGERKIIRLTSSKFSNAPAGTNEPVRSGVIRLTGTTTSSSKTPVTDSSRPGVIRLTNSAKPAVVSSSNGTKPTTSPPVKIDSESKSSNSDDKKVVTVQAVDENTVIKKISSVTITKIMPPKAQEGTPKIVKLKRRSFTTPPTTPSTPTTPVSPSAEIVDKTQPLNATSNSSDLNDRKEETMDTDEGSTAKKIKTS